MCAVCPVCDVCDVCPVCDMCAVGPVCDVCAVCDVCDVPSLALGSYQEHPFSWAQACYTQYFLYRCKLLSQRIFFFVELLSK